MSETSELATEAAEAQTVRFHFHGQGSEFFRIWIVNLVLTILTLGIYSAWAKVRTKRYFYGNTELAGDRFDYLASPIAILKSPDNRCGVSCYIHLSQLFRRNMVFYLVHCADVSDAICGDAGNPLQRDHE